MSMQEKTEAMRQVDNQVTNDAGVSQTDSVDVEQLVPSSSECQVTCSNDENVDYRNASVRIHTVGINGRQNTVACPSLIFLNFI